MKKKIIGLALIALFVICLCASALASGYVYFTGNCNVRSGPGLGYGRIGSVEKGSRLPCTGSDTDSTGKLWYKVSYGGGSGWVSSVYANWSEQSGATTYADNGSGKSTDGGYVGSFGYGSNVYINGDCNVRSGASLSHSIITTVYSGDVLTGTGSISADSRGINWYSVRVNGKEGWVSSVYASLNGYSGSGSGYSGSSSSGSAHIYSDNGTGHSSDGGYVGSFNYGASVYINGDCNVRSGPSLSHSIVTTVYKGDVLTGTGSVSSDSRGVDWYSVRVNGKEGWVSSGYASLSGYSGSSSYSSSSGTVVATDGDTNVRTGPGLSYSQLGTLYRGSSATYLGDSSVDDRGVRWYKVRYNGKTGWVSSKYTTLY